MKKLLFPFILMVTVVSSYGITFSGNLDMGYQGLAFNTESLFFQDDMDEQENHYFLSGRIRSDLISEPDVWAYMIGRIQIRPNNDSDVFFCRRGCRVIT